MFLKNKREIEDWLNSYGIYNYELTPNKDYGYVVNVNNHINISYMELTSIDVKFNIVNGLFNCSGNKLESLEGCPEIVNGVFDCSSNKLESLKWCPKMVSGLFNCSNNKLKNLNVDLIDIKSNYIVLENNNELGELQSIKDFNKIKQILTIHKEKNELDFLINNKLTDIIEKVNKI